MGTNYYLITDPCPHCGRGSDRLHIGKSSAGWCFALHVDPEGGISSLDDWKLKWEGGRIEDEYGYQIPAERMLEVITSRSHHHEWGEKTYAGLYPGGEAQFLRENSAERGPNGLARHRIDGRHCIGHGEGTWDLITGEFS